MLCLAHALGLPSLHSPFYFTYDNMSTMSMSIVSSAKSVTCGLKYQSKLISNLESRAAAVDLVIRSLVTGLNGQVRHPQSAAHATYLLCPSLSSDSGPAPQRTASYPFYPTQTVPWTIQTQSLTMPSALSRPVSPTPSRRLPDPQFDAPTRQRLSGALRFLALLIRSSSAVFQPP